MERDGKEQCYRLVGYSTDFKSKKKIQSGNTGNHSYGSHGSTYNTSDHVYDPYISQANFSYGVNTNVPGTGHQSNQGDVHQGSQMKRPTTESERTATQLLQGYTFTKEQYDQILQMIGHTDASAGSSGAHEFNLANTAGALQ